MGMRSDSQGSRKRSDGDSDRQQENDRVREEDLLSSSLASLEELMLAMETLLSGRIRLLSSSAERRCCCCRKACTSNDEKRRRGS
jgi:hypothetical protein